jgi:hypothetical protein
LPGAAILTPRLLIRLLKNSRDEQGLFLYLVLDRAKANLALARHNLKRIESDLSV